MQGLPGFLVLVDISWTLTFGYATGAGSRIPVEVDIDGEEMSTMILGVQRNPGGKYQTSRTVFEKFFGVMTEKLHETTEDNRIVK